MWHYRATLVRVVDGDTLDVLADLGFGCHQRVRCRLARVDAPELATDEGKALKLEIQALIPEGCPVEIKTAKGDRYGRWIAEVLLSDGVNLSDWLLASGKAGVYS